MAFAQGEAQEWRPDAGLWGVLGIETRANLSVDDEPGTPYYGLWNQPDPALGDGRTKAWSFAFLSPAGDGLHDALYLAVDEGPTLVRRTNVDGLDQPEDSEFATRRLVGDWSIDSSDAATTLESSAPLWSRCLNETLSSVAWTLSAKNGRAQWLSSLHEAAFDAGAWLVDANSGAYGGPAVNYSCERPVRESGWFEGSLNLLRSTQAHTFQVNASTHQQLQVALDVPDQDPYARTFNTTLKDPTGRAVQLYSLADRTCGSGRRCYSMNGVDEPLAGTWTLTLRLDEGPVMAYGGAWCATGDPRVKPEGDACAWIAARSSGP